MTKTRFLVTLDLPAHVSAAEMAEYIRTEVQCGVGQLPPEDPLWHLDKGSVRVEKINGPAASIRTDGDFEQEWLERLADKNREDFRPVSKLPPHIFLPRLAVLRRPVATDGGTWSYGLAYSTAAGWKTPDGMSPHQDCEFKEIES